MAHAAACTLAAMAFTWPSDFVVGTPTPAPWALQGAAPAATVVMFFNLECPGCVARGVPFIKRLVARAPGAVQGVLVHTSYGHRELERGEVAPTLVRFATDYAKVNMPVALDLDGALAQEWGVEGTPHWFVFDAAGELQRSLFGSQDNARTRLEYLVEELAGGSQDPQLLK